MVEEKITIELTPFQTLAIASILEMFPFESVSFISELKQEYNDLAVAELSEQQLEDGYAELKVKILLDNN